LTQAAASLYTGFMPSPTTVVPTFAYRCPACTSPLDEQAGRLCCANEGREFVQQGGIWPLLTTEQATAHAPFLRDYAVVRASEGWARPEPDSDLGPKAAYYLALPDWDVSGYYPATWRRRRLNYYAMSAVLEQQVGSLRLLDLGAGNGWMSNRLAKRGHQLCALDLSLDAQDGLAVGRVYFARESQRFARVQADAQQLPLVTAQFDAVIANDSLHYLSDLTASLREAGRVLKPGGVLLILDSPCYPDQTEGETALSQLRSYYEQFKLPALDYHPGYLVREQLVGDLQVAGFALVGWQGPFAGVESGLLAWWRKLRGRPAPSETYPLIVARKDN